MTDPVKPELSSEQISELLEGQDPLLDRALDRIREEADSTPRAFFKHGQHGSHNSG